MLVVSFVDFSIWNIVATFWITAVKRNIVSLTSLLVFLTFFFLKRIQFCSKISWCIINKRNSFALPFLFLNWTDYQNAAWRISLHLPNHWTIVLTNNYSFFLHIFHCISHILFSICFSLFNLPVLILHVFIDVYNLLVLEMFFLCFLFIFRFVYLLSLVLDTSMG